MRTLFQLIAHEYSKYVFTRGFLLFLLLVPAAVVFMAVAAIVSERASPVRPFVVIDQSGGYAAVIDAALAERSVEETIEAFDAWVMVSIADSQDGTSPLAFPYAPGDESVARRRAFVANGGLDAAIEAARPHLREHAPPPPEVRRDYDRIALPIIPGDTTEETVQRLLPYLKGDTVLPDGRTLFAAVVIPPGFGDGAEVQFWTNNLVDQGLQWFVRRTLTDDLMRTAYEATGVSRDQILDIEATYVPVKPYKADGEGTEAGAAEFAETYIPLGLAYALLIMITTVGGMLLTSTVEEKSNKIVEVLLSSVSATQLMAGKLIGLALVGMTIPTLFLSLGYGALYLFGGGEVTDAVRGTLFGSPLVPMFFFYFVTGYMFYASIYLAVGALSNTLQEAQSFVGPLTIMLFLPFPFLQMMVQDPNGIIARIFTWIPIYTPYAIMMRIGADPPQWEVIGSTSLFLAVVLLVVSTMGRIYRNGVLSSGGAPTLKQVRELARQR